VSPTENEGRGTSHFATVLIAALVGMVAAGVTAYFSQHVFHEKMPFTTPYQAIQLNNGAVYFCKIEGFGTPFPMLKEIYFIQRNQNPETKQMTQTLLKRDPDRMIVNTNNIVSVEPVSPNSRVAELIEEEKSKK
jgi:hypothetical protein